MLAIKLDVLVVAYPPSALLRSTGVDALWFNI